MPYQSLAEMFFSQAKKYGERVLYRFSKDNRWQTCTWQEALWQVREIGLGLLSLGVKKGDRIAIFSANRVEWSLIDWANICIGALTVPIYSSSTPPQVFQLVEHSGSTILFVESAERLAKMALLHPTLRQLKGIIVIDAAGRSVPSQWESVKIFSLEELKEMGRRYGERAGEVIDHLANSLRPEDDLTIMYTSGTTGEPKGVLTTHGHYLFMIDAADSALPSTDQEINLQFLPFAHSFGRLEHFWVVAKGYTCGFARSVETIAQDLLVVRPTILFSVPRIYENAYDRIRLRVATGSALRRSLFHWGISVGRRCSRYLREGKKIPLGLRLARFLAQVLIFSRIHSAFGERLWVAISGGAPLAPEIAEFFHDVGILILEGYGLTETSTVSHVNRLGWYKFGTVGLPLKGVECRIESDGEILLRGPNVFKGYYRDPQGTEEAIDADGWFYTGDVGEVDQDGFLRITGRKKDLIVTSGGKKIAPQMIENLFKTDPLINQVMVIGDRHKHLLALITLNQDQLGQWARCEGLEFRNPQEMASHPRVVALVRDRIRQKNKALSPFETVRDFRILPHDFTLERQELTPTLKLRRQVVMERYKKFIEEMYGRSRFEL